jgi:TrmH family RNA methyltransferase
MEKRISSLQNPLVKMIAQLEKPSVRREQGLFVVEGEREVRLCQNSYFEIDAVISHDDFLLSEFKAERKFWVSPEVMEKIAVRGCAAGLLALVKTKSLTASQLKLKEPSLILVLEKLEKPGNLGAILRTADAASVSCVWVCDPQTDIFNPNVVRSSLGGLFTVPVLVSSSHECLSFLLEKQIAVYAAVVGAEQNYADCDLSKSCALVLGSESQGLSSFWTQDPIQAFSLPMFGKIDSMNVSVCAGILCYETLRQRKFHL